MKRAYIILVVMMVAVLGGAGEETIPDTIAIDQLIQKGKIYLAGPGADATTAKKRHFAEEITKEIAGRQIVLDATVKDVLPSNYPSQNLSLVMLTDTTRRVQINIGAIANNSSKVFDLKVGDRITVTGLISRVAFRGINPRDREVGEFCIELSLEKSEVTVIRVDPPPVDKASPVTDPTPVVKTTPFAKPVSVASVCGKCRGTGKCTWPECRGGRIYQKVQRYWKMSQSTACRECNGTGKCLRCGGTGWEREKEK